MQQRAYKILLLGSLAFACSGRGRGPTLVDDQGGTSGAAGQGNASNSGGHGGQVMTDAGSVTVFDAGIDGGASAGRGAGGGPYVKPAPAPSAGCEQPMAPPSARRTISYGNQQVRNYIVDTSSYVPGKPNRLVFTLHGCGGFVQNGTNLPKLPNFSNTLYVMWQGGDSGCYDDQTRASPEYIVFDALAADIERNYCIDKNRVFATGFSSGAWMAMMLGCQRADVIRAHGQGAGGLPIAIRPAVDCRGPVAALFSHGIADDVNHVHGSRQGRDRLLRTNQCDATTKPFGNFPQCVQYQGCLPGYPVVHCEYPVLGHSPASVEGASTAQFFDQF